MQDMSDSIRNNKKKIFAVLGIIAGVAVAAIIIVLLLRGCDSDSNFDGTSPERSINPTYSSGETKESENPETTVSEVSTETSTATTIATATGSISSPTAAMNPTATSKPTATPTNKVTATAEPTAVKTATVKPTATKSPIKAPTQTPTATISVALPPLSTQVGDVVKYGKYEQDNDTSNGKEDIEWIVLAKENNKILVISKYTLDCQRYNSAVTDITWENCTLRSWLNNDFINDAFSSAEQGNIPTVTVIAGENPNYSTEAGNDTQDKVFLLSLSEVKEYLSSSSKRLCNATSYAISQGAKVNSGYSWWWLRSPGSAQNSAAYIDYAGDIYYGGRHVNNESVAVRPALWIDLNT